MGSLHVMNNIKSEFEKLEEVANIFKIGNFQFNEDEGNYTGTKGTALSYLRGAWVIYQHRQTEVDELQKRVDDALRILDENSFGVTYKDFFHEVVIREKLEQALKGEE